MSRNWETTLSTWAKPASDSEEVKRKRTEKLITDALNDDPAVKDLDIRVYAKGSYANRTNVRADSDVDVNVEYEGLYYYDFEHDLAQNTGADFGWTGATGEHPSPAELKRLVQSAMEKAFGSSFVTRKDKAIEVERDNLLAADVVPCFSYRRYSYLNSAGHPIPIEGTKLFADSGAQIINWPQQHYDNGVAKNKATGERFKKMVRCLKRLENEMVDEKIIKATPSYLIECLVFNVPNSEFGNLTLLSDFRAVLRHIFNETQDATRCSKWGEVNDLKWLFTSDQKWTWRDAHSLADAAWDYVGFTG